MNRINTLFKNEQKNIFSVYFTAGYPQLNDTVNIIKILEASGVDLIEIGMPFSDPLADGPVIQRSSELALENGMSIKLLFEQLKDIRKEVKIPLILMGYLNPVMQFGVENFCKKASEIGIDGVILPDLPTDEFINEYKSVFEKYNLKNILLITPQTSEERIRLIDDNTDAFIYMVSSASTTGAKSDISSQQEKYFERVQNMNLKNTTLIGFGISDNKTFEKACEYSNGAIIGSAFVKALQGDNSLENKITEFAKSIKPARHQIN